MPSTIRGSLIVPPRGNSGGSGGFVITVDSNGNIDKSWGEILTANNEGQNLLIKTTDANGNERILYLDRIDVDPTTNIGDITFVSGTVDGSATQLILSSTDGVNHTKTSTNVDYIVAGADGKLDVDSIPSASTTAAGAVMLSDAIDSDLNAATGKTAATPYAVKQLAGLVGEKTSFREVTQAEYDALVAANTDDPDVIYVITDSDDSKIIGLMNETIHQNQTTWYGTSSTVANSSGKTVTTIGGDFVLKAGKKVTVKFTNGNTASDITLNVDGMGIKKITRYGTVASGIYPWSAGAVIDFIYDGESFIALNATPTIHIGTKIPSAADGIDGDIFLVYDAQS